MERKQWLAGLVMAVVTATMTAQQAVPVQQPADKAKASAPDNGGLQQGIKVHGHWILNVRDEQGKVVEHRDFENAVVATGQTVLTSLLIGAVTPGSLNVAAYGTQGTTGGGAHFDGQIYEVNFPQFNHCNYASDEVCTSNLTVTPVTTNDPNGIPYYSGVSLEGSFKPTVAVVLTSVGTTALMCRAAGSAIGSGPVAARSTYAPNDCSAHVLQSIYSTGFNSDGSAQEYRLTGTSITPLSVAPGQTLDITVVLSFS